MREAGGLMLYPKEEGGRGREAVGDTGVCSANRTREAQMPSLFLPCIRGSTKGGITRLVSSDQRRSNGVRGISMHASSSPRPPLLR